MKSRRRARDPDPNLKPDKIVRWVVDSAKPGSIVVFHMNKNGVHTKNTLPRVVRELRAKGFELVTVSELLGEPVTFTDGAYCEDPQSGKGNNEWIFASCE